MEYLTYETADRIGILTINRPKVLNALDSKVLSELGAFADAYDEAPTDCLIITGAGEKAFAAGADISEMAEMYPAEAQAFSEAGNRVFRAIELLPMPVIAAVNGYALGGGCELAMSCDIIIASDNAIFGQPETGLGVTPGFGGTQRLARRIGTGMAKQLIYTGRNIKAEEALRIGLVNAVYPAGELMNEAVKMAKRISANSSYAVRAAKRAIDRGIETTIDDGIAIEEDLFGSCFSSEDQKIRMRSFLNGRK